MANGKLPILKSSMVDYVKSHAEDIVKGLEVLPGVETLLQRLSSQKNVIIGLVSIVEPILFVTWFFIYFLAYCFFLHVFSVNDFLSVVGKELFVVGTKLYACVSMYQQYMPAFWVLTLGLRLEIDFCTFIQCCVELQLS